MKPKIETKIIDTYEVVAINTILSPLLINAKNTQRQKSIAQFMNNYSKEYWPKQRLYRRGESKVIQIKHLRYPKIESHHANFEDKMLSNLTSAVNQPRN